MIKDSSTDTSFISYRPKVMEQLIISLVFSQRSSYETFLVLTELSIKNLADLLESPYIYIISAKEIMCVHRQKHAFGFRRCQNS